LFAVFFLAALPRLKATVEPPEKEEATEATAQGGKEKGFQPGPFIMEHIQDNHEWHIMEIGEKPISIPLPVIVYSVKQGALYFFMSGKFEHGHAAYHGMKLELEGKYKGKIVEVNEDGTIDEKAPVPLDFSITKNVVAIFFSIFLLLWVFISVAKAYKKRVGKAPSGIQNMMEPLILFIRDDIALPAIGKHKYEKYMPYLLTVFFFIFFNNLMGLIPIFPFGANVTGNIAVTMILALLTFIITTFSGNKAYWLHIVNAPGVPWWLKIPLPLMPVVELIGVFTKPFVLMVRLFANITAGHIIALGFFSLIFIFGHMSAGGGYGISVLSVLFTIFMTMLELLVAFIQAYVFTLLSALYFGMATPSEHH
jgi:F-type H+-transporting ATPase subunit a